MTSSEGTKESAMLLLARLNNQEDRKSLSENTTSDIVKMLEEVMDNFKKYDKSKSSSDDATKTDRVTISSMANEYAVSPKLIDKTKN